MPKRRADTIEGMREFGKDDVRDKLNQLSTGEVVNLIGDPDNESTVYADAVGWTEGDGRPGLASEDPAVMQAIGRCASSRVRRRFPIQSIFDKVHPTTCAWCDYPLEEMLRASAWAVWHSRFVIASVLTWHGTENSTYARPGTASGYHNPEWRRFWELLPKERERRIAAAAGREPAKTMRGATDE